MALSNVFRAKFLEGLQKAYDKGLIKLPDTLNYLADPDTFKQWLYHEVPLEWVVFSKPPFAGPEEVIKYIGDEVKEFTTNEPILEYYSLIGRSDSPYPVAITANYIYYPRQDLTGW